MKVVFELVGDYTVEVPIIIDQQNYQACLLQEPVVFRCRGSVKPMK